MGPSARRCSLARSSLASLCLLYAHVAFATDYGTPIEINLWDSSRTPLSQMVDITNEFGLKVLAEHNFLNDNNIAFSPYGLMGILVALYEGVDGESSYQIQRGMRLPWNRNVMRVGFRDIHRTLKTYFVPEEGFLAGLALNNENVTFNDNYKKVLRFYGFDLENEQLPTLTPENGTATANSTVNPDKAGETTTASMVTESKAGGDGATITIPMREETTPNPNAETINDIDVRGPPTTTMSTAANAANAETTISTASAANAESTQSEATDAPPSSTSQAPLTTTSQSTSTELPMETSTSVQTFSTATETTLISPGPTDSPFTLPTMSKEPDAPSLSTTLSPNEPSRTIKNDVNLTPESTSAATAPESTSADTSPESTSAATSTVTTELVDTTDSVMTTPLSETLTESLPPSTEATTTVSNTETTTAGNGSSLETLERRKKSIVDFIFTNPPYMDDYLIYKSYDVGLDLPLPNFDNKMFLANGLRNVQVTYMQYDTVLEHAYLPHLEATALRLPLDSDRYYLLVVLPTRARASELGRLLSRMARESDLSDVYAALRPRRVRAVVPSFTVKGHVTLTTDLQKLGIRDVFEPRQQDFAPMTRQGGVYVRSVEQAVSVAIRKYRPDDLKKNRYVTNRQPVTFTATYPFLYFVMDASIHVALMAGKMVDPLNTRIL